MKSIDILPNFTQGVIKFKNIEKYIYQKTLEEELKEKELTKEDCFEFLEQLLYIRYFELTIVEIKKGIFQLSENFNFTGATHLSVGQEAIAVGANAGLTNKDYITSTHRGHGHSLSRGFFFLKNCDLLELSKFLSREINSSEKYSNILNEAKELHLYKTFAELFGKEDGYCRGRGGGMHIADFNMRHLGANAIVGGSLAIATGAAIALKKQKKEEIVLCFAGDGASNNGICHEAYNMATMKQFKEGTPIIYLIENNQYGMSGQVIGEVTGIEYLACRGVGYNEKNMYAEVVNGMDVLAVRDAIKRAKKTIKEKGGPVVLECITYRFLGHSLSDPCLYRSSKETESWNNYDPVKIYKKKLKDTNILTEEEISQLENKIRKQIKTIALKASKAKDPLPSSIEEDLFSSNFSNEVKYRTSGVKIRKYQRDKKGQILYRNAISETLTEEMIRDDRIILYGEDVAEYGGAFQATYGIFEVFGPERVFNTAISESAIVGSAIGMAMVGLRPVVEIMYIDFILQAMDQVANQAAKTRYMFGGKIEIPMVIRTTIGGGKGYAGQHSQSLEAILTHIPGLKIVIPSNGYDAKGLLKTAIRDNNVVIFIEHQLLYTQKDKVPEEEYTIPFGQAKIVKAGCDLTLISYSYYLQVAIKIAKDIEKEGIAVEVIDLRTLFPLDTETIIKSVNKTGKVIILSQACTTGSFAEHIAFEIQKNAFKHLKLPIEVIGAYNVPPPMSAVLEKEFLPSEEKIVKKIKEMVIL